MAWQLLQCAQSLCAPSKLRAFSDAGHAVQSPQGRATPTILTRALGASILSQESHCAVRS